MTPELQSLLALYLSGMPPGRYHRRDDHVHTIFCEGRAIVRMEVVMGNSSQTESLVSALVLLLNERPVKEAQT